jgi:Flagellar protein FliS
MVQGGAKRDPGAAHQSALPRAAQGDRDHRGPADERGGDIARNPDRTYTHMALRLQRISVTDDPTICDEVIARLDQLCAAWAQLAAGAPPPAAKGQSPTAVTV